MLDGKGIKILVIEDERPMLDAIVETLEKAEFVVVSARDGEEGLTVAKHEHPDLILLDILMPKMDGLTMLQLLRKDPWGQDVPLIILSNLNPDADKTIKALMELKPAYYLIKSNVTLEGIVSKVKEVLYL